MLDKLKQWANSPATKDDVWQSFAFMALSLTIIMFVLG